MIDIIDFAKLSLFVYHDPQDIQKYLKGFIKTKIAQTPSQFKPAKITTNGFHEILIDPNVQLNLSNDFYASFFVKVENRKAVAGVVVIRGTDNFGNLTQDVHSWWKNFFDDNAAPIKPEYYASRAYTFFGNAWKYARTTLNIAPINMFITGHSLGGAIAAILPTDYGVLARAVTFNAPGISGMQGVRDLPDAVINFRAEHDFVSAIDKPIGSQWYWKVPEKDVEAMRAFTYAYEHRINEASRLDIFGDLFQLQDFFDSVDAQHSMDNLLQAMINAGNAGVSFYDPVEMFFATPPVQRTFNYLGG